MMNRSNPGRPGRGFLGGLRRRLDGLFASKAFVRFFSVAAAVAIWLAFAASDGTLTRQKTFYHIPVTVNGEGSLLARGLIVVSDVSKLLPSVDFVTEVTQTNYERASAASYNPHLELSQVTGEGENELAVVFSSQIYGQVVSCSPASVKVNVEKYVTRRVPVTVNLTGELPQGVYLVSAEADPATLVVSGPQSQVAEVSRIAVSFDRSLLSADQPAARQALAFELQDSAGETVPQERMTVSNQSVVVSSVMVETAVVPMKRVLIDTENLTSGRPAEGYELRDAWAAEESLDIAAEQEVLDAITAVEVEEPMDITGLARTAEGTIRLKALSGLRNRIPAQMTVTAEIGEKTIERTFRNVAITAEGADDSRQVSLSRSRATAMLTGGYHFVGGLSAGDIRLYVDVTGLEPGQYTLPVQVQIDNAPEFACALDRTEIGVTVRDK